MKCTSTIYFKKSAKQQSDSSRYMSAQISVLKHEEDVMKLKKAKLEGEVQVANVQKDISLLQHRKLELEVFALESQLGM